MLTEPAGHGGQPPPMLFKPRLLGVEDVRRTCGVGRDLALQLMHEVGPVRIGRRLLVRPEDLDAHLSGLREETWPQKEDSRRGAHSQAADTEEVQRASAGSAT